MPTATERIAVLICGKSLRYVKRPWYGLMHFTLDCSALVSLFWPATWNGVNVSNVWWLQSKLS